VDEPRTTNLGERVELSGKVALVTGSSRGIGREISRALAQKGARVAVHYRSDWEAARETLASLDGGPHAVFGADVADAGSARGLVEGVVREMGGIDVLVNNAGIFEAHPIPEVDYEGWQGAWSRTIATNLLGPANLSFCAARRMMERDGGRVVSVSSRGAFRTASSSTWSPPASSRPTWRTPCSAALGGRLSGRRAPSGASPPPRRSRVRWRSWLRRPQIS
jgi:NAD(P)-dependent dehydrogenase (short-subunit alcohol dehydrogenase family)